MGGVWQNRSENQNLTERSLQGDTQTTTIKYSLSQLGEVMSNGLSRCGGNGRSVAEGMGVGTAASFDSSNHPIFDFVLNNWTRIE
jgi:uncharacterized protein (DUF2062 family)